MPLSELIPIVMKKGLSTKTVTSEYKKIMSNSKNEFDVLLNVNSEDLKKVTHEKIADAIIKIREGKVRYKPGYDGVYGKVVLDENEVIEEQKPVKSLTNQKSLSEF
jgi:PHP family Zn ribbon phosphoesterase